MAKFEVTEDSNLFLNLFKVTINFQNLVEKQKSNFENNHNFELVTLK